MLLASSSHSCRKEMWEVDSLVSKTSSRIMPKTSWGWIVRLLTTRRDTETARYRLKIFALDTVSNFARESNMFWNCHTNRGFKEDQNCAMGERKTVLLAIRRKLQFWHINLAFVLTGWTIHENSDICKEKWEWLKMENIWMNKTGNGFSSECKKLRLTFEKENEGYSQPDHERVKWIKWEC